MFISKANYVPKFVFQSFSRFKLLYDFLSLSTILIYSTGHQEVCKEIQDEY